MGHPVLPCSSPRQGADDASHLPDRGGHVHGRGGAGRAEGVPPDVALPPPAERPRRAHHIRQNGPGKAGELDSFNAHNIVELTSLSHG